MPIAPIFYILFTAPLLKILIIEGKKAGIKICDYIDDGLLIAKTSKKVTNAAKIIETFSKIEAWIT